jgi:hypothetical protein
MANNFENIDKYFGGEMSPDEMQQFENILNQDPLLQKEFTFQQELVEGIQLARKAELKTLLNNVDVTGVSALESGALTKILGGVVVAGIVAVGTYFYMGDEVEASIDADTKTITEVTAEQSTTISKGTIDIKENVAEEASQIVEKTNPVITADQETFATSKETTTDPTGPVEISEANITEGFEDEDEVSETEAPINHMIAKSKVTHSTIEVTVENNKKYSFHYQVKNNSLSLYGDFSKVYEIIEFHKDGNTSTYLKYTDKYYEIDKLQSKATPLVELSGDGLLSLLDSIENNKER